VFASQFYDRYLFISYRVVRRVSNYHQTKKPGIKLPQPEEPWRSNFGRPLSAPDQQASKN
jgi:hypothetical protein